MTSRKAEVTVAWHLSPRIITLASPATEITIQDLHDTLTDIEDDEGLSYDPLITSAGKESLGGGVTVGITSTLLDAQLAFQARVLDLSVGTVTTPGSTTLTDSAATFITDGVTRGDIIYNLTDDSKASVLSVSSETVLLVDGLAGGTDNLFESADAYEIYAVTQCNVSGGNLVALDSVGDPLDPIFPTFGTQIVRTASSSATIQELNLISEIYGLGGANQVWSSIVRDGAGNMTSARLTAYTDKTKTTILRQWDVTATYDVNNRMDSYELLEV